MLNRNFLVGCGVGGGDAHLYWRIRNTQQAINSSDSTATNFGMREIELRAAVSGEDQANGGAASASSVLTSYAASYAFDNAVTPVASLSGTGNGWRSANTSTGEWVSYQFPSPVAVGEIAVYPHSTYNASGTDYVVHLPGFALDYSDDGATWTEKQVFSPGSTWVDSTWKTFEVTA